MNTNYLHTPWGIIVVLIKHYDKYSDRVLCRLLIHTLNRLDLLDEPLMERDKYAI